MDFCDTPSSEKTLRVSMVPFSVFLALYDSRKCSQLTLDYTKRFIRFEA